MSLFACMEGHCAPRTRLHETCQVQILIRLGAGRQAQGEACNLDEKLHDTKSIRKAGFLMDGVPHLYVDTWDYDK